MTRTTDCQQGFSLLELMITITIMAILLVIAVPSFRDVIHRNQVSSASNAVLASMAYARAEAINRGQLVSMCPSATGTSCTAAGTAFEPGWLVYTYPAGTASANQAYVASSSSTILLRATGAQNGVSIQSSGLTSAVITFGQQGQLKPSNALKFVTCYRSGTSGTGTSTKKAPGAELDVNGSGSVQTKSVGDGASCT
jgi:type IV fimbrial biogenesis protein FimT